MGFCNRIVLSIFGLCFFACFSSTFAVQTILSASFKKIQFISDYVARKLEEVSAHNRDHQVDESLLINGRHLTNVGTFRAYLEHYLCIHPKVHQDMTFLVRQLAPTEHGLPIEIYVFSNDQAWASYEAIQADIFDHVLAVLPLFDLRPFQAPTGADLQALARGPA